MISKFLRFVSVMFLICLMLTGINLFGCDKCSKSVTPSDVVIEEEIVLQKSIFDWRIVGFPYTIQNYTSAVRVFDPNGNVVDVADDGKIILNVVGEYTIIYPSEKERVVALLSKPVSVFNFSDGIKESYPAGTILELPTLSIENIAYDFSFYYIDIKFNDALIETCKVYFNETPVYSLLKEGKYDFEYFVVNDRNERESKTVSTQTIKEKTIFADALDSRVVVGRSISIGYPYAFYDGKYYDVAVSVKDKNGETQISGQSFTPNSIGDYTIKYSADIEGETIVLENNIKAILNGESFAVSQGLGEVVGVDDLPSWNTNTKYDKGLLIKGFSNTTKFNYKGILDLSKLTKNDNLLSVLPYSNVEENAYMEGLRVVFTDVHDESKKISLYFWANESSMGVQNIPSSYSTVELNGKKYGIDNQSSPAKNIRENTGSISFFTSFKGAFNNKSDTFSIQYDYETETLYLTTERNKTSFPMQQYVFLPLSGKSIDDTAKLPQNEWFSGFTTGEVYLSIEMLSNNNAGVYICEVAGKTYDKLIDEFNDNFMIFDKEITSLSSGVINKEYVLPTAYLNKHLDNGTQISITVKDSNGANVNLDNGKFTPTTLGMYQAIYRFDLYDKEKIFNFDILENDVELNIEIDTDSVAFGDYMSVPNISITGGEGRVDYSYSVLLNNAQIFVESNNKYYINSVGELKVKVDAKDIFGHSKSQIFPITILDGYTFELENDILNSICSEQELNIPNATIKTCIEGVGATLQPNIKLFEDEVEKPFTNNKYTVSNGVKEIKITYTFEFNGTKTRTYLVNVLKKTVSSVSDYIITSGLIKGVNDRGITLSVNGNGKMDMPYLISAENLLISVAIKKDAKLTSWDFYLYDSHNQTSKIKLSLKNLNGNNISLQLNDSSYKSISGEEIDEFYKFSFVVDGTKNVITGKNAKQTLLNIDFFDNNAKFIGFNNNACIIKSEIKTTANSEFILCQVGNQYFNDSANNYDGCDVVAPAIVIYGDKLSKIVSVGYTLTIPKANAYDVLSGQCSVSVKIKAGGVEVMPSKNANETYTKVLDEYKTYLVIYETEDAVGNKYLEQFYITVKDEEKPTIQVNGDYETEIKSGKKIKINSFTANDGQGLVETLIFVKNDKLQISYVNVNDEYEFSESGTYEIVYLATDESGNSTRKAYTINVK